MKATFDGNGSVLAITGGANGIGKALGQAAAAVGATVVVFDVDQAALDAATDGRSNLHGRLLDVSDRAGVFDAMASVRRDFGKIDGLVCGAAIQPRTLVHEMDPAEWSRVMRTNLDGVVWCYQAAVPDMIARRSGSILAFTSGLATQGWPMASAYAASKAALIAFMKSAGKEIAPHRVRFNLVSPGVIDTPQYRAANQGADDARWRASLGVGLPEDTVGPLLFLLSDAATMTCSILSRDLAFAAAEPNQEA